MDIDDMESIVCESTISTEHSSQHMSEDFFNHKPLIIAPKGYVGQFDGMIIKPTNVAGMFQRVTQYASHY